MLQSMIESIAAIDFASIILLVGGLLLINFSEKIVESKNDKRVAKGRATMTDDEIRRKVKYYRIMGNVLAGIFLIWIIVQFIDIHFFANV